jgi:phosphatidylglycerophosphatase A
LFRAFDMFKIWPANKFEDMGGSRGIMMDDVMAGIYTNIVLQIATRLAGWI